MTIDSLFEWISKNFNYLKSIGVDIKKVNISSGDFYYSESGLEYQISTFNKTYQVGYCYITEDADDWAQAESYQVSWCDDELGRGVDTLEVFTILENWKQINRDSKLSEIL